MQESLQPTHPALPLHYGEEIARRARQKWLDRSQNEQNALTDWLEAETEFLAELDRTEEISLVQHNVTRLCAERDEAKRRLLVEQEICHILATTVTLIEAAPKLAKAIGVCFGWDVGVVWLRDREANRLRCLAVWHTPQVDISEFELDCHRESYPLGEGMPGSVWASKSVIWSAEVTSNTDFQRGKPATVEELRGAIGFPIHNGADVIGVLEFYSREVNEPDQYLTTMMSRVTSYVGQFIERREGEEQLQLDVQERRIAMKLQRGLLPQTMPQLPGFEISGRSLPIQVGGDCFDFIPLLQAEHDLLGIVIADACGHGLAAALLATQVHAYLRGLTLTSTDIAILLQLTNRCLCENPNGKFVTAFLMMLDPKECTLQYTGAGHPPAYVLDSQGQEKSVLCSRGLPLGIHSTANYPAAKVSLDSGDLVLLFTDGILEAMSEDGELFGVERILALIRQYQQEPPDEILTRLFEAVDDFCDQKYHDDLTALILKVV